MTAEVRAEPSDLPEASTARVDFLVVGSGPSLGKVESSISLVRDGSALMVIDPGMVSDRRKILDPLEKLSVDPKDVTDIVLSHHHPDHTLNAALWLSRARILRVADRIVPGHGPTFIPGENTPR